ncbi:hypothetical protein [Sanguibacteroides justesenii]|uniref:VWA domain-containing protein n=1 Tax=Sanguibacteroides justesenii TaxID=1547597 RepID=A0AB34R985_9PORP|nr:hypothetical protein [Sanguibacteroides justesenii]KIO46023.1 hypothetical protein IE90_06115 [Sanguibacteroides justesenii]
MDFRKIEEIYEEQFMDRDWWGNFPRARNLVDRNLGTTDILTLVPVCARIAYHVTGEIPKMILSNKAPGLAMNPMQIALNLKLLRLAFSDEIRVYSFFGHFVHEMAHMVYTGKEINHLDSKDLRYTHLQYELIHMLEDRRVESKLVRDFPGYHFYLYAARRLDMAVGINAIEEQVGFYGGPGEGNESNGLDGSEALLDYICSKILYPNILEFGSYRREVLSFPANGQKVKEVDLVLNEIKEYADLTYADVEKYAGELARLFRQEDFCPDNFCLQEMKNVLRGVEDFRTDRQIKMAESVIRDMRKTLNSEPLFSNQSFVSSERSQLEWKGNLGCCDRIEEVEAEDAQISEVLLNRAKEFAARIRLSLSMFSAKMDRVRTVYEQDSGELDEDELYQVRYNRYIFQEEEYASSVILEVVILLDLSGSMVTGDKIEMQTVISLALALAFSKYPNLVRFSIYGHRCDTEKIEIVRFYQNGEKLQWGKLFSQSALNANADGYAMLYCFDKFKSDAKNKLFFMISDGAPSATGYDGENAREHVWEVVREGRRRGIEVLSVGIDNFDQADMYDEFIPFSGAEITTHLSRWIRKKFSSIADANSF